MKRNDYIIRQENPGDYSGIRETNLMAFDTGENEARTNTGIRTICP